MEDIKTYLDVAVYGVAIASALANIPPNESKNKYVVLANKVLGFLAANINVKGIANKK